MSQGSQIGRRAQFWIAGLLIAGFGLLGGCDSGPTEDSGDDSAASVVNTEGFELKLLLGSALGDFCEEAIAPFNQQAPTLDNGDRFYVTCEALGSGDVVSAIESLAQQLKEGSIAPDSPEFPTLLSVDGEIYHSQMKYRIDQMFPGQNYIPDIPDAPLLASSPMVFMTTEELAESLRNADNILQALSESETHQDLDPTSPPIEINYVHTAPTRSNSGLQTLVTQFAAVSGKRPDELTIDDVQAYTSQVEQIQKKITRYGTSTSSLAESMVQNGVFWASVGSVYESSVIAANLNRSPDVPRYEAVYPEATFTSNMRAILPDAPWVSEQEQEAAQQVIEHLRSPAAQTIATQLGLRPGVPGIPLGDNFTAALGVNETATYDSYRPPRPEVVETMLNAWETAAKKPSLVAVVVDSSGSMEGDKLPSVQTTLQTYINNLGRRDTIALIDFDDRIREPVVVDGTPEGRDRGIQFISSLRADGGTRLYDAALYARNWLQDNLREDAINAVLVLTDGIDSGAGITLEQLSEDLKTSGFNSDQRIAFFTIGYGEGSEFDPSALKTIAELNGGYYSEGTPETISSLMADLQLEF